MIEKKAVDIRVLKRRIERKTKTPKRRILKRKYFKRKMKISKGRL